MAGACGAAGCTAGRAATAAAAAAAAAPAGLDCRAPWGDAAAATHAPAAAHAPAGCPEWRNARSGAFTMECSMRARGQSRSGCWLCMPQPR